MFKTVVKYKDFIGNDQEETLRFNLSEDELHDLIGEDKSFDPSYLAYISHEKNFQAMYKLVQKMILKSYGVLSEDAKYFDKSEELSNRFRHSAVYQAFLDELISEEDMSKLQAFVIGVFPQKFSKELTDAMNKADSELAVIK